MYFDDMSHNTVSFIWHWDHTQLRIPITVPTAKIMANKIKTALENDPSPQTLYEVARYYQEEGSQPTRALSLIDRAIATGGDTYYYHRVRSLILAALKRYPQAIAAARISLNLARKLGKDEFVRMNEKNIKAWQEQ